jgi:hypothetical protein
MLRLVHCSASMLSVTVSVRHDDLTIEGNLPSNTIGYDVSLFRFRNSVHARAIAASSTGDDVEHPAAAILHKQSETAQLMGHCCLWPAVRHLMEQFQPAGGGAR